MGKLLSKCKTNLVARQLEKIESNTVAWFFKTRQPNFCDIFGFKNSTAENAGILYSHSLVDKPDEKICGLKKCDMTGTLFVTPNAPETEGDPVNTTVTTEIKADGEKFQYGYLRLFIKGIQGAPFTLSVMNMTGEGSNDYIITLAEEGWNAVTIELFNPSHITAGGWIGENGTFKIVLKQSNAYEFELSTIELFENINEMVKDQTFGFQCITDASGDPALTLTEDLCSTPAYDETATKIERSLTASKFIGEIAEFNPLTRRLEETEQYVQTSSSFTAKAEELDGTEYAAFTIPDLADIACPRLLVQPQDCAFDALDHVDIDNDMTTVELSEAQFFRRGNKVYMSKAYIDTKIVVAYPIAVEATAWELTSDDLNDQQYQMEMIVSVGNTDYIIKADNVLMTAVPMTWTSATGTFTVPFTIAADEAGRYGRLIKVDNRK